MVNLEIAEGLQNEGIFVEAIPELKQSIALLSAVLRILGVNI